MRKRGELIVSLDVGTTRTCVVVAEAHHTGDGDTRTYMIQSGDIGIDIIGFGLVPSRGTRKGVVVNMEEVIGSIRDAIRQAEDSSGVEIKAVYAGLKGRHIDYINSHGVIAISGAEVTQDDVDRVINSARAVAIPFDRSILHVVPTGFTINGQNGIHDPRGMEGVRLETGVRIITADAMSVHNLKKACEKAGVEVIEVVFEPIATAMVVLDEDEKEMGVALVDIGGGTTDIAVFFEGNLCHTSILPVGGTNFTNDIAIGLRTTTKDAEEIKKRYGTSMLSLVGESEEIEVGYADSRHLRMLPRRHLIEIIQPRAEELMGLVMDDLNKSGYYGMLASGVVLTGGGALLGGMDIMAENMLELPVRTGSLIAGRDIPGPLDSPAFTSSIGLVLYGAREMLKVTQGGNGGFLRGVISRLREWTGGLLGA
jgi:cell division protein FtsA